MEQKEVPLETQLSLDSLTPYPPFSSSVSTISSQPILENEQPPQTRDEMDARIITLPSFGEFNSSNNRTIIDHDLTFVDSDRSIAGCSSSLLRDSKDIDYTNKPSSSANGARLCNTNKEHSYNLNAPEMTNNQRVYAAQQSPKMSLQPKSKFTFSEKVNRLRGQDVIILCEPTPMDEYKIHEETNIYVSPLQPLKFKMRNVLPNATIQVVVCASDDQENKKKPPIFKCKNSTENHPNNLLFSIDYSGVCVYPEILPTGLQVARIFVSGSSHSKFSVRLLHCNSDFVDEKLSLIVEITPPRETLINGFACPSKIKEYSIHCHDSKHRAFEHHQTMSSLPTDSAYIIQMNSIKDYKKVKRLIKSRHGSFREFPS